MNLWMLNNAVCDAGGSVCRVQIRICSTGSAECCLETKYIEEVGRYKAKGDLKLTGVSMTKKTGSCILPPTSCADPGQSMTHQLLSSHALLQVPLCPACPSLKPWALSVLPGFPDDPSTKQPQASLPSAYCITSASFQKGPYLSITSHAMNDISTSTNVHLSTFFRCS